MGRIVALCVLCAALVGMVEGQEAPASRFVGVWVGSQIWDIESPPPNAKTAQPVELDIKLVDGKLVGLLTPFFGGSDGATFSEAQIVGENLQASGMMGGRRTGWKSNVQVKFDFKPTADRNQLIGTVQVMMGETQWTKYKYELSRRRTRY